MMLAPGLDQVVRRHLDAEIDHLITVVGEDNFDQIFADVVNVALDGGEHDSSARGRIGLLHELLQMIDGGLHRFSRLQHFGDDQFVVIEQAAHFGHAGHERPIDDVQRRRAFQPLQVQVGNQAVLGAFDDVAAQARIDVKLFRGLAFFLPAAKVLGNRSDVILVDADFLFARLLAPVRGRSAKKRVNGIFLGRVEQQIFREAAFFERYGRKTLQPFRIDDGEIEAGLGGMVEEHRVDHFARTRRVTRN